MSTQRYISTSFWDDEWIQSLDPSEKLLYLYYMTNTLTNIAGVYKIASRRVCFDTGFTADTIGHIMQKFEAAGKAYRIGEYIALPAWPKHQKWETKASIKDGIDAVISELPENVLSRLREIKYMYPIGDQPPTNPPPTPHRPTYSDSDSDSDSDSERDREASPVFPLGSKTNGSSRIERARVLWNEAGGVPCKLVFNPEDVSACLRVLGVYSDDEISTAIKNYSEIIKDSEYDVFSQYRSFAGFMRSGVEKFVDEANPREVYRKNDPTALEKAERDAVFEQMRKEREEAEEDDE